MGNLNDIFRQNLGFNANCIQVRFTYDLRTFETTSIDDIYALYPPISLPFGSMGLQIYGTVIKGFSGLYFISNCFCAGLPREAALNKVSCAFTKSVDQPSNSTVNIYVKGSSTLVISGPGKGSKNTMFWIDFSHYQWSNAIQGQADRKYCESSQKCQRPKIG